MRDMFFNMNQFNMIQLQQEHLDGKGKSKIEISDFILLRRLGDFMLSSETVTVIFDNQIYHWMNYGTIQESLPVVFPSIRSLKKRVEKMKNLGLIINKSHKVRKEDVLISGFDRPGTVSVIQLSKSVRKLFDEPIKIETDNEGFPHEGVKGSTHEGVKGCPHKGVKGWPHKGVNKEPQEKNSKKGNPSSINEPPAREENFDFIYSSNLNTKTQHNLKKLWEEFPEIAPTREMFEAFMTMCNVENKGDGFVYNHYKAKAGKLNKSENVEESSLGTREGIVHLANYYLDKYKNFLTKTPIEDFLEEVEGKYSLDLIEEYKQKLEEAVFYNPQ